MLGILVLVFFPWSAPHDDLTVVGGSGVPIGPLRDGDSATQEFVAPLSPIVGIDLLIATYHRVVVRPVSVTIEQGPLSVSRTSTALVLNDNAYVTIWFSEPILLRPGEVSLVRLELPDSSDAPPIAWWAAHIPDAPSAVVESSGSRQAVGATAALRLHATPPPGVWLARALTDNVRGVVLLGLASAIPGAYVLGRRRGTQFRALRSWPLGELAARIDRRYVLATCTIAIAISTWPAYSLYPGIGLDPSWQAALHLAAAEHLQFGRDITFTYGPLGYLVVPVLYYEDTGRSAILFAGCAHIATTASLVWLSFRAAPALAALPLSFVLASVSARMGIAEELAILTVLLSLSLVRRRPSPTPLATAAIIGLAVAGSILVLIKFNAGLIALGAGGLLVLSTHQWRKLGLFALVFVSGLCLVWLLTGNAISNLPSFLTGSIEVASGFSSAMGIEATGRRWEYAAAPIVVLLVVLVALDGFVTLPLQSAAAGVGLLGLTVFAMLKHGFVRHDAHAVEFFASMLLLSVALASRRDWLRTSVLTVALFAAFSASSHLLPTQLWLPMESARGFLDHLGAITSLEQRQAVVEAGRNRLRAEYALDSSTLAAMTSKTGHIDPWESGVAWAYPEVTWRPLPTIQSYVAYSRALDERNQAFLLSERAPEVVLREIPQAIDARNPLAESPLATIQLFCQYAEAQVTQRWQLLQRVSNRCGPLVQLSSVRLHAQDVVSVPKPASDTEFVFVAITGLNSTYQQLRSLVYKSPDWVMQVNDGRQFRLLPGNASSPQIVRLPSTLGFSVAFRGGPAIDAFSISSSAPDFAPAELVVTFFTMTMRSSDSP